MEVKYSIKYHPLVVKEDIPKLDDVNRIRIKQAIEEKLMTAPELFGIPLRRSLKGHRKLRVGDYRIIFRIQSREVLIFIIEHRSVVYSHVQKMGR
ncbi:MAG: Toxin-antitoxin system, toxin component, RelE family [Candidatus Uhrbacteria bacterium GW2011_GWC2_41_11]|uniref:Toxin-antitoxin system, toxin component, RelE family n=1 Tax=Candidatus Uhrbacteria bacterium GW2011_GWC2_41_11 TaxID=1618985 RepID=A0A0G0UBZ8_9BACT|nr:MAG: Toxin-antitoxin system, toxin component, RelE family [Candidatus Uhrbacteria bacterium GW2011_GWC2_41_11]